MNDLISRQAAIDAIQAHKHNVLDAREYDEGVACGYAAAHNHICDVIAILPSAQPERKKGRWLIRKGISDAQCSECKMYFKDVYDIDNSDAFCRHCGAKMEGLKVVKRG